jgi:hypothetical protein
MRRLIALRGASILLLAAALSACTITFEPMLEVRPEPRPTIRLTAPRIDRFEPDRGVGETYRIGEPIGFRVRANADGYVTLTAIDPDGSVYVFARNIPVRAGHTELITGIGPRQRFVVDPPLGLHRVRAAFTPERTEERIVYIGIVGYDRWLNQISLELRLFDAFDQRETNFFVSRR